ncbi:hypothetical protein KEM52_000618 [Ascosphaera acerosa]|nr:hypothetical protein KEM52_000618 [Ascosphaera acerosa]
MRAITVGVLALQGAFLEHLVLLRDAAKRLASEGEGTAGAAATAHAQWTFVEVRTPAELARCDALIIPGGESTTMALVAARSNLLEPLRDFVKVHRKATWGTCAGLIMLAESANRTKKGGQELIGGLDIRVNRNYFGRQTDSFVTDLRLPFLSDDERQQVFPAVFIRAPVVETVLPHTDGVQEQEQARGDTVVAPSRQAADEAAAQAMSSSVDVLAWLDRDGEGSERQPGEIVAVKQGNVFGTSFHPELTQDSRIHMWWLREVLRSVGAREQR